MQKKSEKEQELGLPDLIAYYEHVAQEASDHIANMGADCKPGAHMTETRAEEFLKRLYTIGLNKGNISVQGRPDAWINGKYNTEIELEKWENANPDAPKSTRSFTPAPLKAPNKPFDAGNFNWPKVLYDNYCKNRL